MTNHIQAAKLKKYPNRGGAQRFQAYHVDVEILDRETRTQTFVNADGHYEGDEYIQPTNITKEIAYCKVKEQGKAARWVRSRDVTTT